MNDNYPTHTGCHQITPCEGPFDKYFYVYLASHHSTQPFPITGAETPVHRDPCAYSWPQTNSPTPWHKLSSLIENPITSPVPAQTKDWRCHFCLVSFHRWQDRDRHEQTHLPYSFHCPLPHCDWRGNRTHTFRTHWQKKDHLPFHKFYGRSPERSQIETYDPRPILNRLRRGKIALSEAEDQAIFAVQVKSYELQKPSMRADPQGRSRKQSPTCR